MGPSPVPPENRSRWEFDRKSPNAPQTEPIQGELFEGEALEAPASALVRETIQNSLDARAGADPVRVRFTLPADPAQGGFTSPWLAGLIPHLSAERNGLAKAPKPGQSLSFLLIEDYGTHGLRGDVAQTNDTAAEYRNNKNHFFYFWRAIGSSGKDSTERGSWGLGKTVLPASSTINTFLGVSCQEPGLNMRLMGLSVLRHHNLPGDTGGQEPFTPYGRFGKRSVAEGAAMPVGDVAEVAAFCRDFGVSREAQPGLSLVVLEPPHLTFCAEALCAAAIVQYFYPIIEGQLVVEIVAGAQEKVINSTTIEQCARMPEWLLEPHGLDSAVLQETLRLARWSVEDRRQRALRLGPPPQPTQPRWADSAFAVEGWAQTVARFAGGEPVEFAIPLCLVPKGEAEQPTEFYVCLKKMPEDQRAKVVFLRDGITISGIRETVPRGLSAFVTVEGGPLAAYLRLAENPAHTDWAEDSKRLRERYEKHAMPLRYVKNSVKEILNRLTRPKEGINEDLLADDFFLEEEPPAEDARPVQAPGGRGLKPQRARVPKLAPTPDPLRINKRGEDIVLSGVPGEVSPNDVLEVRLAYDLRRSNPLEKWSRHDFDLAEMRAGMEWSGALLSGIKDNGFDLVVEQPDFEVVIRGLDPLRDVFMRVDRKPESA